MNVAATPQYLRKGLPLAYLEEIDKNDEFNKQALLRVDRRTKEQFTTEGFMNSISEPVLTHEQQLQAVLNTGLKLDKAKDNLTKEQFIELTELLYEFKHLFITDDSQLEEANLPPIDIHLKDDKVVRQRPYRLPEHLDNELNSQLSKMRDAGILEDTDSPYSTLVFLVKKATKPGEKPVYRVVADFRKLNENLEPTFHVPPTLDSMISKIGNAQPEIVFDF